MFRFSTWLVFIFFTAITMTTFCQQNDGKALYNKYCATCHGSDERGGMSNTLMDSKWEFGSDDLAITRNVKFGIVSHGMPSFTDVLDNEQIGAILTYVRNRDKNIEEPEYETMAELETFDYKIKVETVAEGLDEPWAIDFINPLKALVTEKPGRLRIIENGKLLKDPVEGTPEVLHDGQGGLLDVAIDPDYSENGWIYLSFSHAVNNDAMTKIVRGKLDGNKWVNEEVIFEAPHELYIDTRHHYGSRIVFDKDGYLYFSIGDRGQREQAQDLNRPNGKIHRIHKDGKIPADNPFLTVENSIKSIFAYGTRNAQGLAINPETGELWETEHGQLGGDEVNIIRAGKNYGWDKVTYGRNYNGTVSTEFTKLPGMEIPIIFWRPSIAACGLDFYDGDLFPKWKNHLIAGALKFEEVRLLDIEDNRIIHQEIILKEFGRVRDVCAGPDGAIYIALNEPGKIIRLVPDK